MAKQKRRNPDHVRRRNAPAPDNEAIKFQLTELLTPAIAGQMAYYRQLGMRSRILTLPLMVAASAVSPRVDPDVGAGGFAVVQGSRSQAAILKRTIFGFSGRAV